MNTNKLDFYKGMDISFLPEFLDEGMQITDFDGTVTEPFPLMEKYGVNAIRLRIWNNPENIPESKGYCSLSHTIAMAHKIKTHNMNFMLDFHYSDYWADPSQQNKPKSWVDLSLDDLEEAVFRYTRDTLLTLQAEGVMPDMVQIGNEIRSGLLFPEGELPNYAGMVRLVNAGIRGARSVAQADLLQVIIHLDQGGRYHYIKEWFTNALANGLMDFDIIGLSYYPFWHGTFMDLQKTLKQLIEDYNKPLMILETAHAWRKSKHGFIDEKQEKIAGFPATPEGQHKVLDMVMNIMASLPNNMGMGMYYWEPLCVPRNGQGGWSENMGLLNEDGKALEGLCSFLFTRQQHTKGYAKVFEPAPLTILVGRQPELPDELAVLRYDGTIIDKPVEWKKDSLGADWVMQPGDYTIVGTLKNIEKTVTITVHVRQELPEEKNILHDTNWEEGLTQWKVESSDEQVMIQLYPRFIDPFPAPPLNALRVEAKKNFTFQISQQIRITDEATYKLQVEFMGTDTTNVDIRLFARTREFYKETMIHPSEHEWTLFEIDELLCQPGYLIIGISMKTPPIYGMMQNFRLTKHNS
jgi:arabinogalactan endo-1,4-beta-galactosidase